MHHIAYSTHQPDANVCKSLVIEGGAMRGIFAAGVLDAFLEHKYQPFWRAYGVSAGATNLIGYLSGNHGRNRKIITGHACQPEFINWTRFVKGGHLCDVRWLWHQSFADVPLLVWKIISRETPSYGSQQPLYVRGKPAIFELMKTTCTMCSQRRARCPSPIVITRRSMASR